MTCLLLVSVLCGCGWHYGEKREAAQRAVANFRYELEANQFHRIYSEADEVFRKATSEDQWTAFASAINRKLGRVQTTTIAGEMFFVSMSGTTLTFTYKTQFSNGTAEEQFVWLVKDRVPTLIAYRISSPELVIR